MTAATQEESLGSTSNAPTITSEPRGSLTMAERKKSCCSRNKFSLSATLPPLNSGPPLTTMRVGSPPVCESTMETRFMTQRWVIDNGRLANADREGQGEAGGRYHVRLENTLNALAAL